MYRFCLCLASVVLFSGVADAAEATAPSYAKDVVPFMKNYCLECHSNYVIKAGVKLDTYDDLMKTTRKGKLIVAGKPDDSKIIHTMTGKAKQMPPKKSNQPTAAEVTRLKAWIADGAKKDAPAAAV